MATTVTASVTLGHDSDSEVVMRQFGVQSQGLPTRSRKYPRGETTRRESVI
jgi:hypothetical protein